MRSFSAGLQSILNALGQPTFACLVSFTDLGVRYTNWPQGITYGGQAYTAATFEVTGLSENYLTEAPAASLRIGSLDLTEQNRFFADSFRGETVTVRIVYLDSGTWTDTGAAWVFTADADQATADEVTIRLSSSDAVEGTDVPRRTTQEAGCQHDYLRNGCTYRGARTLCDKGILTPNGCRAHYPDLCLEDGILWISCRSQSTHTLIVQPLPYGACYGGLTHRLVLG